MYKLQESMRPGKALKFRQRTLLSTTLLETYRTDTIYKRYNYLQITQVRGTHGLEVNQ